MTQQPNQDIFAIAVGEPWSVTHSGIRESPLHDLIIGLKGALILWDTALLMAGAIILLQRL